MGSTTPSAPSAARATRRLVLRPGTHVLRRSASELQVGLDPRRAVVLPDHPGVRALLARLARPAARPSEEPYDGQALDALTGSGLLMDLDTLLPLMPSPPRHGDIEAAACISRTAVAALAADVGDGAASLLARRAGLRVEVLTCGSVEAVPVAEGLVELLSGTGVHPRLLPHGRPPADGSGAARPSDDPVAGLLVAVGEPPRELVDGWMRAGRPHLLLRLTEGHVVVGPFVRPGETACLRCVDAHHTDVDPAWPLLVTQYASASARRRDDTVPEPVDPLLATLAGAWAGRELVSYAEGRVPATTGATLRLDPQLTALETHRWPRHAACGCGWDE